MDVEKLGPLFNKLKELNKEELQVLLADIQYLINSMEPNASLLVDNPKIEGFQAQSLNITFNINGQGSAVMNSNYPKIFGSTIFYKYWTRQVDQKLIEIDMEDYGSEGWNLESIYFRPRLISIDQTYTMYDLLNDEEKKFFNGLGTSVLNGLLKYMIKSNIASPNSAITMGATNVLKKKGDIRKLVEFYKLLSFEIDYKSYKDMNIKTDSDTIDYQIDNTGNKGFLEYVPMISTFEKVIKATNFP